MMIQTLQYLIQWCYTETRNKTPLILSFRQRPESNCTSYQIRTGTSAFGGQIGYKCASLLWFLFISVLLQILFISRLATNNFIQSLRGYDQRSFTTALPFKLKRFFIIALLLTLYCSRALLQTLTYPIKY